MASATNDNAKMEATATQLSPYPGYAPAKAYGPPEVTASKTAGYKYFTADCALEDDPFAPQFYELLRQEIQRLSPPEEMSHAESHLACEEIRNPHDSPQDPLEDTLQDALQDSPQDAPQDMPQEMPQDAPQSMPQFAPHVMPQFVSQIMLQARSEQPRQMLENMPFKPHPTLLQAAQIRRNVQRMQMVAMQQNQHRVGAPSLPLLRYAHFNASDRGHRARAIRFLRSHPHIDRCFRDTKQDLDAVLALAQTAEYFELDNNYNNELLAKFICHEADESPLACAVRFAQHFAVDQYAWKNTEEHLTLILTKLLDARGRILLKSLNLRDLRAKNVRQGFVIAVELSQQRRGDARLNTWTVEDVDRVLRDMRFPEDF